MAEPLSEVKNNPIEIDGLEDVFEADCEPIEHPARTVLSTFKQGVKHGAKQGAGMSLKAASIHYKMAPSTLRLKIKRGEISAQKVHGDNGPEWRVFPTQLDSDYPDTHPARQGAETLQAGYQGSQELELNRLLNLIEKQSTKLEAAAGQVGYLKAQLDTYQEQMKLLPDLQAQASKALMQESRLAELENELSTIKAHWWYHFWSWFTGR